MAHSNRIFDHHKPYSIDPTGAWYLAGRYAPGFAGLAAKDSPLGENSVRELHRRIVFRSQPEIAGIYSALPRRTCRLNPVKIPSLMKKYGEWLGKTEPNPAAGFDAHYRLVAIHPFADGNGRAAGF